MLWATLLLLQQSLEIGSPAPDFDLPGVDGERHALAEYAGAKALVILFTCNHCPTAQRYEGRLVRLVKDYEGKSVQVVAINPNDNRAVRPDELAWSDLDDSLEAMKIRAGHKGFTFPYLDDGETQAVSKLYGPVATPHAFVFDAGRRLRYSGRIDDNEREELVKTRDLRAAIDAVLEGREPEVKTTKIFGCSTKWSDKRKDVEKMLAEFAAEEVTLAEADAAALQALRGPGEKLRLINVWTTSCGPCVAEFPELVLIGKIYRNRGLEFVSVAAQAPDEREEVLAFLKQRHASGRNLLLASAEKYPLLEAIDAEWQGAVPFTLLLDKSGAVLYRMEGRIDPVDLRRAIVKALDRK